MSGVCTSVLLAWNAFPLANSNYSFKDKERVNKQPQYIHTRDNYLPTKRTKVLILSKYTNLEKTVQSEGSQTQSPHVV